MKRIAFLLAFALVVACNDPTAPKKPPVAAWTCADLKPSAAFSWSVDPVLDTLVTLTIQARYPESSCPNESVWMRWSSPGGFSFRNDTGQWHMLANGRLETSSTVTKDDWGTHGDKIVVTWGMRIDEGADSLCVAHIDSLFDCVGVQADTLRVRELLP